MADTVAGPVVTVRDLPWTHVPDADSPELDAIARREGFHELDIEDCRHHRQIAKITEHETYSFLVAKSLHCDFDKVILHFEDFNIFIKPDHIVTVLESPNQLLDKALARLNGIARPVSVPKLVHTLLDVLVDEYQPALFRVGEEIDGIEDAVMEDPSPECLQRIFHLRRMLLEFRRNAINMRDLLNYFLRRFDRPDPLHLYFRDIYEHLVRTIDLTENYRELLSGALDIYLSSVANRTNEVMKVLTIYGTVAIPMVVITGFYGMNVALPWQHSPHAIWLVVGIMGAATVGVLWYFRRKGWW